MGSAHRIPQKSSKQDEGDKDEVLPVTSGLGRVSHGPDTHPSPSFLTEDNRWIGTSCTDRRNARSGKCDQGQQSGRADERDGVERSYTE